MRLIAVLLAASAFSTAAFANDVPSTPPAPAPVSAQAGPVLPADTEVTVRLSEALSSKQARKGQRFAVAVARDVVMGDRVVIPQGTPGSGEVTWRTGRGAFGKSGKMEIAVRELRLGDRVVPVSGQARVEGDGNTGATIGAVLAAGVVAGAFVTGHSAVFHQGHELRAVTTAPVPVELAATTPTAAPLVVASAAPAALVVPVAPPAPLVASLAPPVASAPVPAPAAIAAAPVVVAPVAVAALAVAPVPVMAPVAALRPAVAPVAYAAPVQARSAYVPPLRARVRETAEEVLARRIADAQPFSGRRSRQGWTISD